MNNKIHPKPVLKALLLAFSVVAVNSSPSQAQSYPPLSETKKPVAELAVNTVSKQLSINPANIKVIHVSDMNWPNSSLGCPQPGIQYLQMITRGSLVLLQANRKAYRVHIGNNRAIICDKPMKRGLSLGKKTAVGSTIQRVIQSARQDLAKKLGVAIAEIFVIKVESQTWPNSSLGCPDHGQDYAPNIISGYRITMDYKGQEYRYHTDQQKVIPCPPIERE